MEIKCLLYKYFEKYNDGIIFIFPFLNINNSKLDTKFSNIVFSY